MHLKNVDLPEPDGPTMHNTWPRSTVSVTPLHFQRPEVFADPFGDNHRCHGCSPTARCAWASASSCLDVAEVWCAASSSTTTCPARSTLRSGPLASVLGAPVGQDRLVVTGVHDVRQRLQQRLAQWRPLRNGSSVRRGLEQLTGGLRLASALLDRPPDDRGVGRHCVGLTEQHGVGRRVLSFELQNVYRWLSVLRALFGWSSTTIIVGRSCPSAMTAVPSWHGELPFRSATPGLCSAARNLRAHSSAPQSIWQHRHAPR